MGSVNQSLNSSPRSLILVDSLNMKTALVLLVVAYVLSYSLIEAASTRKDERKEAAKAKKQAEKKAEKLEKRSKEARDTCEPLIDMMTESSGELCNYRTWKMSEILDQGDNFTCFEDLKSMLLEKFDNYTKMDMEDMEGMDMGGKMNSTDGETGAKCDKECRQQARKAAKKDAKKAAKKNGKGGDDEDEDEDMLDFGVEFDLGMDAFMMAVNVTDIDGLKNMPFRQMISNLGDCKKCMKKPKGCMKLNAWLGTKMRMGKMIMEAIEENGGSCTDVAEVLMEKLMDMYMMEDM